MPQLPCLGNRTIMPCCPMDASLVLSFECIGFDGIVGLPGGDIPDGETVIVLMGLQLPIGRLLVAILGI